MPLDARKRHVLRRCSLPALGALLIMGSVSAIGIAMVTQDRSPRVTIASLSAYDRTRTPPWGYRVLGRQTAEYAAMIDRLTGLGGRWPIPAVACPLWRRAYQCVDQMVLCNRAKRWLERAGAPYEFMHCTCGFEQEILRERRRVEPLVPPVSGFEEPPHGAPTCEPPPLPPCPGS